MVSNKNVVLLASLSVMLLLPIVYVGGSVDELAADDLAVGNLVVDDSANHIAGDADSIVHIPDEVEDYCNRRGYYYAHDSEGNAWCYFRDNSKCDARKYFEGECGQEYIRPFPCVEKGQVAWDFQECCPGLKRIDNGEYDVCGNNVLGITGHAIRQSYAFIIGKWVLAALLAGAGMYLVVRGKKTI